MIKKIKSNRFYPFFLAFLVVFLLSINYSILRSARNTITVADIGGTAASIPFFELFGVLPAACLMTWGLSCILRRFSMKTVFLIMMIGFLIFFLGFSIAYPTVRTSQSEKILKMSSMLFFVMGELWKPIFIQILFWGLLNLNISKQRATKIYPLLVFGSCCGGIAAGPITSGSTSNRIWKLLALSENQWIHSFILIILIVSIIGIMVGFVYFQLCRHVEKSKNSTISENKEITFKSAIETSLQFKSLRLFSWIIIADYIAYSLGEVIFLEVLRQKFPNPIDFCRYHGHLSSWTSGFTLLSALVITPYFLNRYRWLVSAMILPVALLIIEGSFFIFLRVEKMGVWLFGWTHREWLNVIIALGSLQYCTCRAIKYTFFDCSKELAFSFMPRNQQISGKLVIDGICARLGRGGASCLSLSFFALSGGVLASSLITGVTVMGVVISWIFATNKLGAVFNAQKN